MSGIGYRFFYLGVRGIDVCLLSRHQFSFLCSHKDCCMRIIMHHIVFASLAYSLIYIVFSFLVFTLGIIIGNLGMELLEYCKGSETEDSYLFTQKKRIVTCRTVVVMDKGVQS